MVWCGQVSKRLRPVQALHPVVSHCLAAPTVTWEVAPPGSDVGAPVATTSMPAPARGLMLRGATIVPMHTSTREQGEDSSMRSGRQVMVRVSESLNCTASRRYCVPMIVHGFGSDDCA